MQDLHKKHIRPREHGRLRRGSCASLSAKIIRTCFGARQEPVLIAVGGPGGTGKTTFSEMLAEQLGDAAVLKLDDYKTARAIRQKAKVFGPDPAANKMTLITEHLKCIRLNQAFAKPVYNRVTGENTDTEEFRPAHFNVIDGEVSTYPDFRNLLHLAIFIDSDWRTQLNTRLGRDLHTRKYSPEKAVATFLTSNLREFGVYGAASKKWADIHLFCHEDYRLELESISAELYAETADILHDNELETFEFSGLIVPLLTPFTDDGKLHLSALAAHLQWLAENGVRRVLIGDSVGEFFSLTATERLDILKLALEYFPGMILFHAGGSPLPEVLHLTAQAQKLGADAVTCSPPLSTETIPMSGLKSFFQAVVKTVQIPLFLCSYPHDPRLAEVAAAIFEQTPDISFITTDPGALLKRTALKQFIAAETQIHPALTAGATGFISAAANVFPQLFADMETQARAGAWTKVAELQRKINLHASGLRTYRIAGMKKLLRHQLPDYPEHTRPPL